MSKRTKQTKAERPGGPQRVSARSSIWIIGSVAVLVGLAGLGLALLTGPSRRATAAAAPEALARKPVGRPAGTNPAAPASTHAPLPNVEVNQALMVTVELDFAGKVPSIAEALTKIERRHEPEDGAGRTFAILDAYGEPTPDGKLHMSMHLSFEKPGIGTLVFRPKGEVLWRGRIVPAPSQRAATTGGKNLLILVDNGKGKTFTVDGSTGPSSILDAGVKELGIPMREFWPDGAEREVTFLYSACGCPVKAMVRRVGEITARTKELPVMFPDDPPAMMLISRLMGWQ